MAKFIAWLKQHHILCTYSKWKRVQGIITPTPDGIPILTLTYQSQWYTRTCSVCGKVQTRR